MRSWREWLIRLRGSLGGGRPDHELEEELRFHLDAARRDAERRGVDRDEAQREAWRRAGSVADGVERVRDQRGLTWIDDASGDLRHTLRLFARAPAFTVVAVLTLGLGISASTVMFSAVNAVVLASLPYPDPTALVVLWTDDVKRQLPESLTSYPVYVEWKDRNRSFTDLGFSTPNTPVTGTGAGEAERLDAARATTTLFTVLGVSPLAGRIYSADEDRRDARVAVVSRGLAERRFGGAVAALNRVLTLDGEPTTIVGVLPDWFALPAPDVQLWRPLGNRRGRMVVIGRLRYGTDLAQARREMDGIGRQLAKAYPESAANPDFPGFATNLVPLDQHVTGRSTRVALWILLGAALLMMLIACSNVGTLLLARAAARERELALKVAIGASRSRLVRQMIVESSVIAAASAVLGTASALWMLRGFVAVAPPELRRVDTIGIDRSVLLFTVAIAAACSLILGVLTAWRVQNVQLDSALRGSGRDHGGGRRRRRPQRTLIIGELAVTLALVCAAGLVLRSVGAVQRLPLGFATDDSLVFRTVVPNDFSPAQRQRFFDATLERIQHLPGVYAVGVIGNLFPTVPPNAIVMPETALEGRPSTPVLDDVASPHLFSALRVPLRAGRFFTDSDARAVAPVAIVNERFAGEFWGGADPIGRRFRFVDGRFGRDWVTVVGVVGDMRRHRLELPPAPQVFVPFAQMPSRGADIILHGNVLSGALASTLARTVADVDPNVPVYRMSALDRRLDAFVINRRFQVLLLSTFAGAAVLLAAIGVYGLLRHDVAQRATEIGLRMAVGASRRDVVVLVLKEGLWVTAAGLAIGWAAAFALAGIMAALVYGVSTRDPLTFVLAPAILLAVAAVACLEPAWRALRVDPLRALRTP